MLKLLRWRKQIPRHLSRYVRVAACVYVVTRHSSSIPKTAASSHERRPGSQAQTPQRRPNTRPEQAIGRDEQIVTSSLEETLQSHRDYNAERVVIRKIRTEHKGDSDLVQAAKRLPSVKRVALERQALPFRLKWEDYAGEARNLSRDWAIPEDLPRSMQQPWMSLIGRQESADTSGIRRLSSEIEAANRYFTPTPQEARAATEALADVRRIIPDVLSYVSKIDLIGSRQSQLSHALSDLDINLVLNDDCDTAPASVLRHLFHSLRFNPKYRRHQSVLSTRIFAIRARVPVIGFLHVPTGLECQVQCTSSGYGSLEVARGLRAEFPSIEPLFRVVRQMLRMRQLCNSQSGGLTSYPVLNMIAVSLKLHASQSRSDEIGQQLLDFLQFYSSTNFYTRGITYLPSQAIHGVPTGPTHEMLAQESIDELVAQDPVGSIPVLFDVRKNLRDVHKATSNFMMTLHDPANLYNDLGITAFLIKTVQETFRVARQEIMENMSAYEHALRAGTAADNKLSLLSPIISGDYSLYQLSRSRLIAAADFH